MNAEAPVDLANVLGRPDELKVLVVIASFGEKNLEYLQRLICTYQAMSLEAHVVVTAEATKSVDLGVDVVMGTPTRNPRSLPFAHKHVFAESIDKYDLFIYTEDDILVTEVNIRAFVRAAAVLDTEEIAGFIRFEVDEASGRSLPDVHGRFHWRPDSVRVRGDYLVAEFTNEHSGFFVLTNAQLRHAMSSGTFLRSPYEGRYEMLESAATDIYVNYGFRKVICVSHFEEFMVHHLPNRYVGQMGVPLALFEEQIETLKGIHGGTRATSVLCEVEPKVLQIGFAKRYDETPSPELLSTVPGDAATILSIGCGSGATELQLRGRGAHVTVFPLDSVVGNSVEKQGIEVIYGSLEECFRAVEAGGRRFDCVLMANLLHLLPAPEAVVSRCSRLVNDGGSLVIEGKNFERLPVLLGRIVGVGTYAEIKGFVESGMHPWGPSTVTRVIGPAGFSVGSVTWVDRALPWPFAGLAHRLGRFAARTWIFQARRLSPAGNRIS